MNALQQKCRPKHQVLVLKCYPRTTKGAVDVKPNSSELSYLLFYATSRRSKIQKIGAFLEKKTASDVWRMRIGNVQVTLGILAALVDKSPKDLALIAPCILKVLDLVLRSNDITMVESSLPTFQAFCDHHEASSLFADHDHLQQYRSIVTSYARLASSQHVPGKAPVSRPVQMRWRTAGLDAIKYVSSSDALSSVTGRQIDVIIPTILDNLCPANDDFLDMLLDRVEAEDRVDAEKLHHRRTSVATVKTADTAADTNPLAISGTALDVDKIAEEGLGVLAMQCLKSVFVVPNRAQIHAATVALLSFISQRPSQGRATVTDDASDPGAGWAIKVFGIIARWAPVQDRYVILLAALDTMWKTPLSDDSLAHHLALTGMIQSLLRSDINLIGLSVMDVDGSSQSDERTDAEREQGLRSQRKALVDRLERCIGDLATHVYYADQIADMVLALIDRLKPGRSSSSSSLPRGDEADGNENGGHASASALDLPGSQSPSGAHVSSKILRISALRVIKAILIVANPKTNGGGNMDLSRNRVPITVWEGTQWLLREPDGLVRKAYVDALVTWLDRETTPADSRAQDELAVPHRQSVKGAEREPSYGRRVVSAASARERQPRERRCQVLPLLHLAAYDSALQFLDFDSDIALLHNLLARLVIKLGVNAARYGIPMVYRLQEDVQVLEQPIHKVRIAALCHGYFWALIERFGFESSVGGRAIQNEIARRRSKGFWAEGVLFPPPSIGQVGTPGQPGPQPAWDLGTLEKEALLPFDDRASLVQGIAESYQESSLSPPGSPGASQGRAVSNPILSSSANSMPSGEHSPELPVVFRDSMLSEWSRDGAIAALAESRTESLDGSRTGVNGGSHHIPSPYGSVHHLRPHSSQAHGERLSSLLKPRKTSARSGVSPSASESSRGGIASVEQLKMILSGNATPHMAGIPSAGDDSDESMVSYEDSPSERSLSPTSRGEQLFMMGEALGRSRSASGSFKGPLTSNPPFNGEAGEEQGEDDVPPVPPLPKLSALSIRGGIPQGVIATQDHAVMPPRLNTGSRGGESVATRPPRSRSGSSRGMDLQDLLRGIDSRAGDGSLGNLIKPPY
ncbi:protein EFR3 [Hirsutella rhossiliensis]|uniref:Protein EFR3 n=1 Tax=Hirsutella rhossiliensis TaxID=111463 RepID=A0A9P8MZT0_9HYPO|nr:protein EFR3 [Hirsutella rhossiliensis]KAH0964260.1 protein EFR3 [Hirsutella rhossiliensis]